MDKKIKIGITIGDPSGIGPEVVIKSLKIFRQPNDCEIFVFADKIALMENGLGRKSCKFNLVDLNKIKKQELKFGVLSKKFGLLSLTYLNEAVRFIKEGIINCLVTAPVSKKAINLNNIRFYGHTEFLARSFGIRNFVMMFISKILRVSLVTRHIPLKKICNILKKESIYATVFLTYGALKNYFKIEHPKIAICGLNPHASENGLIGREEKEIIIPAINQLKRKLAIDDLICGPFPADTVFYRALKKEFDAVVCMYHDQGLIPFKMLNFFEGVNLTLGLPFIRTSPDHGTAFDIAGKNEADCHSMLEAIILAYKLTKNRLRY